MSVKKTRRTQVYCPHISSLYPTMTNTFYYGDNLDILRQYAPGESVDLIYLGLAFNSDE